MDNKVMQKLHTS